MPKNRTKNLSKEKKKGESGIAPQYITRTRAVRKLQITLKDFRRLCILKGIYPRDPKKKNQGKGKTYYHVKDILFLAHEPLLKKFREIKSFLKKHKRAYEKKNHFQVETMLKNKPRLKYDHLVKERYPQFVDAIKDLDDPLCMVHLYAVLPSGTVKYHTSERATTCLQLCREFQNYVIHTKGLRKVFVSIKGYYYQAQIEGETVTWLVPHNFNQRRPQDVDYRVLLTFLDFYETLVKFVNFKLYHTAGLLYPPELDTQKDDEGRGLDVIRVETEKEAKSRKRLEKQKRKEEKLKQLAEIGKHYKTKPCRQFEKKGSCSFGAKCKFLHPGETSKSQMSSDSQTSSQLVNLDKSFMENLDAMDDSDEESAVEETEEKVGEEFGELEDEDGDAVMDDVAKSMAEIQKKTKVFSGLKFLLGREVPRDALEFVIKCGSGEVVFDESPTKLVEDGDEQKGPPGNETDKMEVDEGTEETPKRDHTITHQVIDRPTSSADQLSTREYVQPQWIFDSFNESFLLPAAPYAPNVSPPPHLSPFVDDERVGYVPKQREILDSWKQGKLSEENAVESDASDEGEESDDETRYQQDLEREKHGSSASAILQDKAADEEEEGSDADADADSDADSGADSDNEIQMKSVEVEPETKKKSKKKKKRRLEDMEKDLQKIMMTKKNARLYSRMMYGIEEKKSQNALLLEKRGKLEKEGKRKTKKQKTSEIN